LHVPFIHFPLPFQSPLISLSATHPILAVSLIPLPLFSSSSSIETVEDMIKMGVYVNDLNLHDSSRELILAGTQQSAELQLALDQVSHTHFIYMTYHLLEQHTTVPWYIVNVIR
jgi:2-succinyl-5-enolpyruvyl-6-hydroxy-3-cyclohexene-1-carboxylate synthase